MSSEMKKVQPTLEKLFLVFSREATIVKKHQRQKSKILFHSKIMKLSKYCSCCNLSPFYFFFCIIIDSIYFSEDMPCNDFGHVDYSLTFNQPKPFCIYSF